MNELIIFLLFRGWSVGIGELARDEGSIFELVGMRGEHTLFVRANTHADALRAATVMALKIDAEADLAAARLPLGEEAS